MRLLQARSSVNVGDDEWGFGQILPVFLLLGPIIMTIQAVILPGNEVKEAENDNISHTPDGVLNRVTAHSSKSR